MGLLDDAIREHLELKRRRGADPGEVEREEAEALGPVRRGEVDVPEVPEHDDHPEAAEPPFAHDAPSSEPEPTVAPQHGDPVTDQATREFSARELHEAVRGPAEPAADVADEEEDEEGIEDPDDDDDVLEETPEFLQETPEHDRLWFEQKPPKDFDF